MKCRLMVTQYFLTYNQFLKKVNDHTIIMSEKEVNSYIIFFQIITIKEVNDHTILSQSIKMDVVYKVVLSAFSFYYRTLKL